MPRGPNGANYDGVLRMLDVLLSNETSEAEERKILQDDYDIKMTQTNGPLMHRFVLGVHAADDCAALVRQYRDGRHLGLARQEL